MPRSTKGLRDITWFSGTPPCHADGPRHAMCRGIAQRHVIVHRADKLYNQRRYTACIKNNYM